MKVWLRLILVRGLMMWLPVCAGAAGAMAPAPEGNVAAQTGADIRTRAEGSWTDGRSIITLRFRRDRIDLELTALMEAAYGTGEPGRSTGELRRDDDNPDEALRHRVLVGIPLLEGAVWRNDAWHGRLYDPDGGHTWHATLSVQPDGYLHIRGHAGITLLGRTVVFTRVLSCSPQVRAMRIASGLPDCLIDLHRACTSQTAEAAGPSTRE